MAALSFTDLPKSFLNPFQLPGSLLLGGDEWLTFVASRAPGDWSSGGLFGCEARKMAEALEWGAQLLWRPGL